MTTSQPSLLVTGIGELYTLDPLVSTGRTTNIRLEDLGTVKNAWLAIVGGRVTAYGTGPVPTSYSDFKEVKANGGLVIPGFVDSHTHPIFAGSRTNEFLMRMNGATYQEIATGGGGITSSMKATRSASDADLTTSTLQNLRTFLSHGVTTVEAKSGYGLSPQEELRLLRILVSCRSHTPQTLYITCLALHAKSPEYADFKDYAQACVRDLLPAIEKEKLADAVDAFIEAGYFSIDDTREFFSAAKDRGIAIRLHADEFSDARGGSFAAELKAKSADHLQFVSDEGLKHMAEAGVTATILPGTSLYTNIPFTNGKRIIDAGVPLAIATDFNPGSCVINNLSLVATVASIHCGVPPAAVLAGVTWIPANSLDLGTRKGALAKGFDGDFTIWPFGTFADWIADFGRNKPRRVFVAGQDVTPV